MRALVGGAYRDVLASADAVAGMASSAARVVSLVADIEAGARALAGDAAAGAAGSKAAAAAAAAAGPPPHLHALGARVRYLVDAPDGAAAVAGADAAAARLARAGEVHRVLLSRAGPAVASRFPLLARAWPGAAAARDAVLAGAVADLAGGGRRPAARAARALAAGALLAGWDGATAADAYVKGRLSALEADLGAAAKADADAVAVSLAEAVLDAAAGAMALFGGHGATSHTGLQAAILAAGAGGELDLPPLEAADAPPPPRLSAAGDCSCDEEAAFVSLRDAAASRCGALPAAALAGVLERLAAGAAAAAASAGARALAGATDASQLRDAARAARGAAAAWAPPPADAAVDAAPAGPATPPRPGASPPDAAADPAAVAAAAAAVGAAAGARAGALLDSAFCAVAAAVAAGLTAAADAAAARPTPEPAGEYSGPPGGGPWRDDAEAAAAAVTADADAALDAAADLAAAAGGGGRTAPGGGPWAASARDAAAAAERAAAAGAGRAAGDASAALRAALGPAVATAGDAERSLLVAALASSLADRGGPLAAALGPRARWPAAARAAAAPGRRDAATDPALAALDDVASLAASRWATWAAAALAGDAAARWAADAALAARRPRAPTLATLAGGVAHALPSSPSPAAALLLIGAGREVARAGGPRAPPRAAPALAAALAAGAGDALARVVAKRASAGLLSDAGRLQLLLDARALARGLSRGRVGGGGSLLTAAEASISAGLDPVDWASFEPHLWAAEAASAARGAVLLGALAGGGVPLRGPTAPLPTPSAEANTLVPGGPPCARFASLPVPAAPGGAGRARRAARTPAATPTPPAALVAGGAPSFSFADVGTAALRARLADGVPNADADADADAAARAGARAGAGAQGWAALGALGDRAAEAAAAASLSLGDLGVGGVGGLLNSLRGFGG